MSRVRFEKVTKMYGSVTALQSLDLDIQEGEFLTLLGPSGCGKTTTLRLIAGFITPTNGNIYLGEEEITHLSPEKRNVGMVFQDYALFPHMTVEDNVAFGLVERGVDKQTAGQRVRELLDLVKLPGVEDRFPSQMSGGQQQRIAVARAVAYAPKVLLMDEPLGALDLKLRESMQTELRRIQQDLGITAVYVTHDQTEAMSMSDRIAVMNLGVLEQIGTAREIYDKPKTKFVADFVGQTNLISGKVLGREGDWIVVEILGSTLRLPNIDSAPADGTATVAIRPERLKIARPGNKEEGMEAIEGSIVGKRFAGNLTMVYVAVGKDLRLVVEDHSSEAQGEIGDSVLVQWKGEDAILLMD